jgi:hypothetical protein
MNRTKQTSFVCDLGGIHKCFYVGHNFIDHPNSQASWCPQKPHDPRTPHPNHRMQMRLWEFMFRKKPLDMPELFGCASWDASVINEALEKSVFNDRLEPWPPNERNMGMVSILLAGIRWKKPGSERAVSIDGERYPGFLLTENFFVGKNFSFEEPVFQFETQNGDGFYLVRTDKKPHDPFEMYKLAEIIVNTTQRAEHWDGVIAPMVHLDMKPDISWIKGMWHPHREENVWQPQKWWEIDQTLQHVIFKMNQKGASVKSVTSMRAGPRTCSVLNYYEINGPFLCVMSRPNVGIYFVGFIAEDCFRDPGELDI